MRHLASDSIRKPEPLGPGRPGTLFTEGQEDNAALLTVKRTFYVKVKNNDFFLSLDGTDFKPFQNLIKGSFGVGVSGQPANELQMSLKAELR